MNIFNFFKKHINNEPINDGVTYNIITSTQLCISFTRNDDSYKTTYHFVKGVIGDDRFYIIKDNSSNCKDDYMTIEHAKELRDFLNKHLGE